MTRYETMDATKKNVNLQNQQINFKRFFFCEDFHNTRYKV